MDVADWLPIQQHGYRGTARTSRLHDQVHFAGSEREHDLPRAFPEFNVLTFASPVALQSESPWLAAISPDVGLVGDSGVRGWPVLANSVASWLTAGN